MKLVCLKKEKFTSKYREIVLKKIKQMRNSKLNFRTKRSTVNLPMSEKLSNFMKN